MASGDGIDSIELESASSSRNPDISSTRITDDNDKERPNGGDGRTSFQDGNRTTGSRYAKWDKERKIGHRRVLEGGEITYKKIQTSQIMGSIQLGIQHTVGSLASKPKRDLLMMDFWEIESISFPPEGSSLTPAHHYSEFRFKIYAPIAFRYFRDLFGIQPDDFMMSMCSAPLRELSNPGASGSIFYLTDDDEFIIKTVQHKEGEFLQKLLPGYYMNLNQNPRTLLPKFFGLYCFQCNSKNVRLVVMNNLLPSYVKMHLKYDLKGSTYKRKASKAERGKSSPTYKDLDFMEHHPNGIFLEADTYNALIKTIQRDCTVLESFKIMDYSLLVGIHNLDLAFKEKQVEKKNVSKPRSPRADESDLEDAPEADQCMAQEERERGGATALNRSSMYFRSINRQRLVAHSTAMESIQAESEPIDEEEDVPPGGIPARSEKGERLLLFIGIIDILQSYRLKKKLEHTFKSIIHDGDTVSVCRPSFYAQRFQNFMAKTVFKKIPSPLKHSPSKRKSLSRVVQRSTEADSESHPIAGSSHHHHHISSSSQKAVPNPPISQPTSLSATKHTSLIKSNANTTNVPPLRQKTVITKSKVPPPVPPRGSPKVKGQVKKSSESNLPATTKSSPTGTSKKTYKYPTKSLEPVPKFGEKLSPCNVQDWLEVNDFFNINYNEKCKERLAVPLVKEYRSKVSNVLNTNGKSGIPPIKQTGVTFRKYKIDESSESPSEKSPVVTPQEGNTIFLRKDLRRQLSKSSLFQRKNSFLSQSGRSSIGSIVQSFPPIAPAHETGPPIQPRRRQKAKYLEYMEMAIGDDDDLEDNIINSLSAFVEVKREIESRKLPQAKEKKGSTENTQTQPVTKKTHISTKSPSIIMECATLSDLDTSRFSERSDARIMSCFDTIYDFDNFNVKEEFV